LGVSRESQEESDIRLTVVVELEILRIKHFRQ
jgi:hypothetical protein